jgi:hypothetical protein
MVDDVHHGCYSRKEADTRRGELEREDGCRRCVPAGMEKHSRQLVCVEPQWSWAMRGPVFPLVSKWLAGTSFSWVITQRPLTKRYALQPVSEFTNFF